MTKCSRLTLIASVFGSSLLLNLACGHQDKDSDPAPAPAAPKTGLSVTTNETEKPVDYKFNLTMTGSCDQTGRTMTLTFNDNGQYAVTDNSDASDSISGVYRYTKTSKAITLASVAVAFDIAPQGTCRQSGSQMECVFNSTSRGFLECSRAVFDRYALVQEKIDSCE
jgi:hypothetical protein